MSASEFFVFPTSPSPVELETDGALPNSSKTATLANLGRHVLAVLIVAPRLIPAWSCDSDRARPLG
jgi:hypothetical protein